MAKMSTEVITDTSNGKDFTKVKFKQVTEADGVINDVSGEDNDELVGSSGSSRNWRGVLIALLVIIGVCLLIFLAVIVIMPKPVNPDITEPFTFEDAFNASLQPRKLVAHWLKGQDAFVYRSDVDDVLLNNITSNQTTLLMSNLSVKHLGIDFYSVSPDLQYVLIAYDIEMVFRHSFLARYKIYVRGDSEFMGDLVSFPFGESWEDRKVQLVTWSTVGNSLVFVYDNNIYSQSSPYSNSVQLTLSGDRSVVFNGVPDWMYEEEILESNSALWVSPSGQYLSYTQISDENVPVYDYMMYGSYDNLYGDIVHIHYPKAGDQRSNIIPKVTVKVLNLWNFSVPEVTFTAPAELLQSDHYLLYVTWLDDSRLFITWSNRVQNSSVTLVCTVLLQSCHKNYIDSRSNGWITKLIPTFVSSEGYYFTILSQPDGEDSWKHLARMPIQKDQLSHPFYLTQGDFEVKEIVGLDESRKYVYFLSTGGDAREIHLYRVSYDNDNDPAPVECMDCDQIPQCRYVTASFSATGRFYILGCLGPGIPTYYLRDTQEIYPDVVVENNTVVKELLRIKALPVVEYHKINATDGTKVWCQVLLPRSLIKSHITQYPTLVNVYNGPESQGVTWEFRLGFPAYLVSTEKVIYVTVDGRGTASNGDNFMYAIYRQLGTLEVQDQITAVNYLTKTFRYVDRNRTAIWGWSYGGFVAAHALGSPSKTFQCAVAIAPVTDWRYYDAAYTERYMRLANIADNYRGYDKANVSAKAENFIDRLIMIIHGTADDNVHFQHSAQLIKALTEVNADFRTLVYPDQNHNLRGGQLPLHMYKSMLYFLQKECWQGGQPRDVPTIDKPHLSKKDGK